MMCLQSPISLKQRAGRSAQGVKEGMLTFHVDVAMTKRSDARSLSVSLSETLADQASILSCTAILGYAPLGQPICSVTDSSNSLIPFQAICTPMQTRKNDDNCVITVIPVAPRIRANRSANP